MLLNRRSELVQLAQDLGMTAQEAKALHSQQVKEKEQAGKSKGFPLERPPSKPEALSVQDDANRPKSLSLEGHMGKPVVFPLQDHEISRKVFTIQPLSNDMEGQE